MAKPAAACGLVFIKKIIQNWHLRS